MKFMDIEVVSHKAGFRDAGDATVWVRRMRRAKFKLGKIHLHPALISDLVLGRLDGLYKGLLTGRTEK